MKQSNQRSRLVIRECRSSLTEYRPRSTLIKPRRSIGSMPRARSRLRSSKIKQLTGTSEKDDEIVSNSLRLNDKGGGTHDFKKSGPFSDIAVDRGGFAFSRSM